MGRFLTRLTGRAVTDGDSGVPTGFADVADALRCGDDACAIARQAGRDLAREGIPLAEVLESLAATYRLMGVEPGFALAQDVAVEWSEESLRYAHATSCADPLTGLSSLQHLKSRLDGVYRKAEADGGNARTEYAVVVVDFGEGASSKPFGRSLQQIELNEILRRVYQRDEVVAAVGPTRLGVLVRRDDDLARRSSCARELVTTWARPSGVNARVWIEALPESADSACFLVDELAR